MLKFISSKKKKNFDGFREKLSPLFYYSILSSPQKEKIKKERRKIQSINVSHCFIIPLCVFSSKQKKKKRKKNYSINQRPERDVIKCFANYVNVADTPRKILALKSVTVVFIFTWRSTYYNPNDIKTWP